MGQVPLVRGGRFLGSVDSSVAESDCQHREIEPYPPKDCHAGCCDGYRCKSCGFAFRVECPD